MPNLNLQIISLNTKASEHYSGPERVHSRTFYLSFVVSCSRRSGKESAGPDSTQTFYISTCFFLLSLHRIPIVCNDKPVSLRAHALYISEPIWRISIQVAISYVHFKSSDKYNSMPFQSWIKWSSLVCYELESDYTSVLPFSLALWPVPHWN